MITCLLSKSIYITTTQIIYNNIPASSLSRALIVTLFATAPVLCKVPATRSMSVENEWRDGGGGGVNKMPICRRYKFHKGDFFVSWGFVVEKSSTW